MDCSAFLDDLRAKIGVIKPGVHEIKAKVQGLTLCFRLQIQPGAKVLVLNFHGATSRTLRRYPTYNGFFKSLDNAHQLSIADPSLQLGRPFNIAWYAGHEGFDTQDVMKQAIACFIKELGVSRTVYFGASGGGFAALYFSHADPGSVVVACNPQTRISRYHARLVSEYRTQCWPKLKSNADIEKSTCGDVRPLYEAGFPNTVIYVQSLGDEMHMVKHMLPFLRAAARANDRRRLLPATYFSGEIGHVASPAIFERWIEACCEAPSMEPADLLTAWHALDDRAVPAPTPARPSPDTTAKAVPAEHPLFASADLALAERLASWRGQYQ